MPDRIDRPFPQNQPPALPMRFRHSWQFRSPRTGTFVSRKIAKPFCAEAPILLTDAAPKGGTGGAQQPVGRRGSPADVLMCRPLAPIPLLALSSGAGGWHREICPGAHNVVLWNAIGQSIKENRPASRKRDADRGIYDRPAFAVAVVAELADSASQAYHTGLSHHAVRPRVVPRKRTQLCFA